MNATEKHGSAAIMEAINPNPKGRSYIHGFTIRADKPAHLLDELHVHFAFGKERARHAYDD